MYKAGDVGNWRRKCSIAAAVQYCTFAHLIELGDYFVKDAEWLLIVQIGEECDVIWQTGEHHSYVEIRLGEQLTWLPVAEM